MKRLWSLDELVEHFTLTPHDFELMANKTGATRLGFAVLLKCFQHAGRFPRYRYEVPPAVVDFIAHQLELSASLLRQYKWKGRSIKYHRAQIRQILGYRLPTARDAEHLTAHLVQVALGQDPDVEMLKAELLRQCRQRHIEPPTAGRIERIVRSALSQFHRTTCELLSGRIEASVRRRLDALLEPLENDDPDHFPIQHLKQHVAGVTIDTVAEEIDKLERLRRLELPPGLFDGIHPKLVRRYCQRAANEYVHHLRDHPPRIRYTLLAAFCHVRQQETTDALVELLIQTLHRIGARAEKKVEKRLLADFKRVLGKNTILLGIAEAALAHPEGKIRDRYPCGA